jgi:hypothetical protein
MKIVKKSLVMIILGVLCINCSAQTITQNDIFGFGQFIGVIVNNKVQFYSPDGKKWTAIPQLEMALPNGYRNVFEFGQFIGVIVNNKVQFYSPGGEKWTVIPQLDFNR